MDEKTISEVWHNIPVKEVIEGLGADPNHGLSERGAEIRRKKFGLNRLPEEKALSGLKLFLEQFTSPLIYILVIAGIATFFLREYTDTIVIFAAVGLNTTIGYFQENKASRALSELKKILKVKALVFRDGHEKEILQEELVPGDIIVLKPGSKVPADARLIEAKELNVNESALTGESMVDDLFGDALALNDVERLARFGNARQSDHSRWR